MLLAAKLCMKPDGKFCALDPVYFEGQSWINSFVISRDRGQNVKTAEEYDKVCHSVFLEVSSFIKEKPLRLPYDYYICSCRK